LSAP